MIVASVSILLVSVVPLVDANPAVIISDYELSPEIFMPGDSGLLTLTITNAETTAAETTLETSGSDTVTTVETLGTKIKKIWVTPDDDDGGREVKAKTSYSDVGYLAAGASIIISFELVADENISEGLYFPKVRINVGTGEDVSFPIPVEISNASVDLVSTKFPSKISMSGSTEIKLTAINNRANPIDGVTIAPESMDEMDFVPEGRFISTLDSYGSEDVIFSVKPSETGSQNLTFKISYKNGNNAHDETLVVPVEIIETLDVSPVFYSIPSTIEKGKSTRIRLEVFNAKTEEITGVIVTPITNVTVFPSQYFIGSMDPDDVFSASFDVYTDNIEIGNHSVGFKVSFKQGDDYYETPIVSSLFEVTSAKESEGSGGLGIAIGIIIAIIIVVLILLYVRKKRRIIK
ncbi:MAG: hypothetical protein KAW47_10760 [Thermoplasmatales archaeon]|nr:hypothetical protein [Thermoplasmatales archaeon]